MQNLRQAFVVTLCCNSDSGKAAEQGPCRDSGPDALGLNDCSALANREVLGELLGLLCSVYHMLYPDNKRTCLERVRVRKNEFIDENCWDQYSTHRLKVLHMCER